MKITDYPIRHLLHHIKWDLELFEDLDLMLYHLQVTDLIRHRVTRRIEALKEALRVERARLYDARLAAFQNSKRVVANG